VKAGCLKGNMSVDRRIMLKKLLEGQGRKAKAEVKMHRTEANGGLFMTRRSLLRFHRALEVSWRAQRLVDISRISERRGVGYCDERALREYSASSGDDRCLYRYKE
jgi:hypothetical protein